MRWLLQGVQSAGCWVLGAGCRVGKRSKAVLKDTIEYSENRQSIEASFRFAVFLYSECKGWKCGGEATEGGRWERVEAKYLRDQLKDE